MERKACGVPLNKISNALEQRRFFWKIGFAFCCIWHLCLLKFMAKLSLVSCANYLDVTLPLLFWLLTQAPMASEYWILTLNQS